MAAAAKAAKADEVSTADAPLLPISPLLQNELWAREAGVKFNTWEVVPPAGTPFENVLRADFWANVAQRMKPGDKVLVYPRDGSFYAELLVWDAGQNWVHLSCLQHEKRPDFAPAPGVEAEFVIERDPIDGVVVKRRSNGQRVKANFPNAEDARRWILEHQRSLRR